MDQHIANLNETQILSEIRKVFVGETLNDIDIDTLMDHANTLDELMGLISNAIEKRDSPEGSEPSSDH